MQITHASEETEGGLSDLVTIVRDVVRRRWLTMAAVAIAVMAIGVGLVFMMKPKYTAAASVRIDPSRNPLAAANQDTQATLSPEAIETEVSVLSSIDLARDVVRRLHLERDPEFVNPKAQEPGAGSLTPKEREDDAAELVKQHLGVNRDKLTYILSIRFTASNAVKAARIANAYAEEYIDTRVGSKAGTAQRQTAFFQRQLAVLGRQVEAADAQVAQYRARNGIVGSSAANAGGGTIVDQQVGPLSGELATAESEAAAARANLNAAGQQVAGGGLDTVSAVLSSPVITELRRQRAEVERNMEEVNARYGAKHPESLRVRDQLTSIDSQIKDESNRVVGSLRAAANAAEARSASLRSSMNRLEGERATNTRNSVMADSLERQASAKRAAYERLSQMSVDSSQAAQNSIAQAEIVDRAQPGDAMSSPNKPLMLALSLLVGLGAGAGTVAVQEMLVSGMRTVSDVETQLGVPLLAAVPKVPKMANPADLLLDKPTSLFAESLRIARASILGVRSKQALRVIAITSALPSEGKTTTALAFARTLAGNNAKTLLIECDVRRAAMRALVGKAPTGPGIVEVLHGDVSAQEAITPGDLPGLDHLLVQAPYFSSEDLFGAGGMEALLNEMRERYDLIVLDLPPLVGLADGRFLAVLADATALCVKWDETPPAAATAALSWLTSDEANPIGVIYTMVDPGAEAMGGLYYSKKYSAYYQAAA